MSQTPNDKSRWTWSTIFSVAVLVFLGVAGLLAILGVMFGWIDSPPDPEGTYPDPF